MSIALDVVARRSVRAARKIEDRVERRMRAGARRVELHGDAGVEDLPARGRGRRARSPKSACCAVHRVQKTLRTVERLRARRQSRRARAAPRARRCARPVPHAAASPSCRSSPSGPTPPTRRSPAHAPVAAASSPSSRLDAPRRRQSCRAWTCSASRAGSDAGSCALPEPRLDLEADDVRVEDRGARTRLRLRPPREAPARAARSDARATRSTCRRSRARARRCRWPARRRVAPARCVVPNDACTRRRPPIATCLADDAARPAPATPASVTPTVSSNAAAARARARRPAERPTRRTRRDARRCAAVSDASATASPLPARQSPP